MKTKKEILEFNLQELIKILKLDNLSMQSYGIGDRDIFYNIIQLINAEPVDFPLEPTEENKKELEVFRKLNIDKYFEVSLKELQNLKEEKEIDTFCENMIERIKSYGTIFISNNSKK